MRCCKSQNRENKRDGASGYGKDYNAVVCKKYGVHHGTTSNGTSFRRMSYLTRQTQLTLRPPLITQSYSLCVMSALGQKQTYAAHNPMSAKCQSGQSGGSQCAVNVPRYGVIETVVTQNSSPRTTKVGEPKMFNCLASWVLSS